MEFLNYKSDTELQDLLLKVNSLKADIDNFSVNKDFLWPAIHKKLRYSWTYNTNAIEGSTLSEGETIFFLQEGLTVEGKPLKDFLDAQNHHEAIEYLYEIIKGNRPITEGLIKEFNALLMANVKYTKAIDKDGQMTRKPTTPGQYKQLPNHVLQRDNTIHYYVEPVLVPYEMEKLVNWINENLETLNPVIVGAAAHYNFVKIHPFDDGNGRGARLLMNLILIKKGLPPAIIETKRRREYLECLIEADKGDLTLFIKFMAKSLIRTQEIILEELK